MTTESVLSLISELIW